MTIFLCHRFSGDDGQEVAVKIPRFRIAWVMVFVAVAALNFAVFRAAGDSNSITAVLLALGAMPMATVLAIGLIIGHRRHESRPFLLGFESFGAMALALFAVLSACFAEKMLDSYIRIFIDPLSRIIGPDRHLIHIPVAYVALGLPQAAFALIGGLLSGRFRVTITRR
jgi:hypothetical protein